MSPHFLTSAHGSTSRFDAFLRQLLPLRAPLSTPPSIQIGKGRTLRPLWNKNVYAWARGVQRFLARMGIERVLDSHTNFIPLVSLHRWLIERFNDSNSFARREREKLLSKVKSKESKVFYKRKIYTDVWALNLAWITATKEKELRKYNCTPWNSRPRFDRFNRSSRIDLLVISLGNQATLADI